MAATCSEIWSQCFVTWNLFRHKNRQNSATIRNALTHLGSLKCEWKDFFFFLNIQKPISCWENKFPTGKGAQTEVKGERKQTKKTKQRAAWGGKTWVALIYKSSSKKASSVATAERKAEKKPASSRTKPWAPRNTETLPCLRTEWN